MYGEQFQQPRIRRRHFILWPLIIAGVIAAFQYFSAPKYVNPETGRVAHLALSQGEESALGLESYNDVLSHSQVVTSGPEVVLVQKVMNRLVKSVGDYGTNMDWQVSLVDNPQANAFCLPGGKMVVYTGILPIAQSEAGLATVLGHEIAHATSRHGSQRLLQSRVSQTLMTGAGASVALGNMDSGQKMAVMAALGAGSQYGITLPFSRSNESEADEIGLYYMARAGYDPHEAILFWQRMDQNSAGKQPPEFASTHPSEGTRIDHLKACMPRAEEEYHKAIANQN